MRSVSSRRRHRAVRPLLLALSLLLMGALYAALAIVATVGPGAGLLAAFGIDTQLSDSDTWAMIGRMAIAFVLWTLVGIGVGTLVRNQIAAVVGVLAFTQFVEPIVRSVGAFVDGVSDITAYLPGAASDALVGASIYSSIGGDTGPGVEWWVGGLVLLGYAVLFLLLGWLFSWRRDVT